MIPCGIPHGFTAQHNFLRVVNNSVKYGGCSGCVTKALVPVLYGKLTSHQGRAALGAILKDF